MAAVALPRDERPLKPPMAADDPCRKRKVRADAGLRKGPRAAPVNRTPQPGDIVPGERHGQLIIISRDESSPPKNRRFLVRCDCGTEYVVSGGSFRKSMSCLPCSKRGKFKHGRHTQQYPLYLAWARMRHRCYGVNDPGVARWRDRGITVCDEWNRDFRTFETWSLAHGFRDGLSLDRVDNDGNYEPSNCEWVTRSENSRRARAQYKVVNRREYEALLAAATG